MRHPARHPPPHVHTVVMRPQCLEWIRVFVFSLLLRRNENGLSPPLTNADCTTAGRHRAGVAPLSRACSSAFHFRVHALLSVVCVPPMQF